MNGRVDSAYRYSPTLHISIFLAISAFVTLVAISVTFKTEIVARGAGRIVPLSRVQSVQPEFDGRITAIHVSDGTLVESGDVLLEFDTTDAQSELATVEEEKQRLLIEIQRISVLLGALGRENAFSFADSFSLPPDLQNHPYAREQQRLFEAEIEDFRAANDQFAARKTAIDRKEGVTRARIEQVDLALRIQSERLAMAERLVKRGTSSRAAYLDVLEVYRRQQQDREIFEKELGEHVAERALITTELRALITSQQKSLLERQSQIDGRLAILNALEVSAQRKVKAAVLKAPVSGVVDQLKVNTIGGIVNAAEDLARIVPSGANYEIEGVFSNQDIGFLAIGQKARLSMDAYPSERYGHLNGFVSDIAADSVEDEKGSWGFVVRIRPNADHIVTGSEKLLMRPGMTVEIDIITGKRRLISYFFAPIVETIQKALRER